MFPDRQLGPHRDWKQEIEYLDNIFKDGSAYTVGKVNGDHWLLYLTNSIKYAHCSITETPLVQSPTAASESLPDYTIEILMSELGASAREPFFSSLSPSDDPHAHGAALSSKLGITEIFPSQLTTLDAYTFSPCGYSSNALVKWTPNDNTSFEDLKEGYYTIHVTPEEGWSYASFECNIPSRASEGNSTVPDLKTLVERVVNIFQPGRLSLTLFMSKEDAESDMGESVEVAQKAFKQALVKTSRASIGQYQRTDKINYEFGGYDLAFASFQRIN
jgi:S-adenosylmethionine decarboxylase